MRDPARIDGVLAALKEAWLAHPDWRLGQLISNVGGRETLFALEDDEWEWRLGQVRRPLFERVGYTPAERQARFHKGVIPAIGGGRGGGRTTALIMETAAACDSIPGLRALYWCSTSGRSFQVYREACRLLMGVGAIAHDPARRITFDNCSVLQFGGGGEETTSRLYGTKWERLSFDDDPPIDLDAVRILRSLGDNATELWAV